MTHVDQSKRALFRYACGGAVGGVAGALAGGLMPIAASALAAVPHAKTDLSPDQALRLLKDGNANFITDGPYRRGENRERRIEIALSQTPFAVLVSCSDSRVPPELLFGRGLGELFIVRNAGNTVDTSALGSIEYAVAQLGVPLIVVMGHERCGAVDAAVSVVRDNTRYPGSIGRMIEPIIPAVLDARDQPGDLLDNAVRANVRRIVRRLSESEPMLIDPLRQGKLKIVGARYDLEDGSVDFFTEA
ncbi:carbonic anhydrase [Skermanella stibiiresistens SB22]|uniref:Carbonic anhydrase n=1 Tax=Skermanella stibiiresistens SB22 TaxID=1385369 RepID=W9H9J1_9PROT|nr:carbonic anhydrase [Skermanella stibiiresistens]EWY40503.1 carbonic anhydrase [Skermanella stibiiresistens SB22]